MNNLVRENSYIWPRRDDPMITSPITALLGLTDEQINAWFIVAGALA